MTRHRFGDYEADGRDPDRVTNLVLYAVCNAGRQALSLQVGIGQHQKCTLTSCGTANGRHTVAVDCEPMRPIVAVSMRRQMERNADTVAA